MANGEKDAVTEAYGDAVKGIAGQFLASYGAAQTDEARADAEKLFKTGLGNLKRALDRALKLI